MKTGRTEYVLTPWRTWRLLHWLGFAVWLSGGILAVIGITSGWYALTAIATFVTPITGHCLQRHRTGEALENRTFRVHLEYALTFLAQGHYRPAKQELEELIRQPIAPWLRALAVQCLGVVELHLGDPERGLELMEITFASKWPESRTLAAYQAHFGVSRLLALALLGQVDEYRQQRQELVAHLDSDLHGMTALGDALVWAKSGELGRIAALNLDRVEPLLMPIHVNGVRLLKAFADRDRVMNWRASEVHTVAFLGYDFRELAQFLAIESLLQPPRRLPQSRSESDSAC